MMILKKKHSVLISSPNIHHLLKVIEIDTRSAQDNYVKKKAKNVVMATAFDVTSQMH